MSEQNIPGDISISTVSLYVEKGVVNIQEHVYAMSITESIITPGIVAELTIWDTMNIASLLPILGGERLVIEFNTPGRKKVKYDLVLTSLREAQPSDNMRSKAYTIMAASPETVVNKSINVCKAYNTTISNIVSDIAKNYLKTKRTLNVKETRGIQKIIVPSISPFDAIKMLRKRSSASDEKSSAFVFFENQEGLHFTTIEKLMTQGDVGDRVFMNDESVHTDITKSEFRNIIWYEQPHQFDIVNRLASGGVSREVQKFDFKTLTYKTTISKFNPSNYKNPDGTLKDPDNPLLASNYGTTAGSSIFIPHDSGIPDTFISDADGTQKNATSLYKQGTMVLSVFGDSELTAGKLIETKIVETSTATLAPEEHTQLSGKYLIGCIQHIVGPEGLNPRYTCTIDAIKGGYKDTNK